MDKNKEEAYIKLIESLMHERSTWYKLYNDLANRVYNLGKLVIDNAHDIGDMLEDYNDYDLHDMLEDYKED